MRKVLPLLVLLFAATGLAVAAGGPANAEVSDFTLNAGIGDVQALLVGVSAGAEYIFAKADIPNFAPFTFGAAVKVLPFFPLTGAHWGLTGDVIATAHFGLKAFSSLPKWLQNFDWYLGAGPGGFIVFGTREYGIGLDVWTGTNYYFSPSFSIGSEAFYNVLAGYYGATLGVKFKL